MKKIVLLALGTGLSLSTAQQATAQKAAAKPAAATAAIKPGSIPATWVDLDLTSSGMPVRIKAPKDTKVEVVSPENIILSAPGYAVRIMSEAYTAGMEATKRAEVKKAVSEMGVKSFVVDEPLAFWFRVEKEDVWAVMLPAPAAAKIYMIDYHKSMDDKTVHTSAQLQAMFDAARGAKLAGK